MEVIEECMKMTSFGGQAKSLSIQAIGQAREGNIVKAEQVMAEAEEYLNRSHEAHTNLLGADAESQDTDQKMPVTFFMVHAADHLSSADTMFVLAKEIILLYKSKWEE